MFLYFLNNLGSGMCVVNFAAGSSPSNATDYFRGTGTNVPFDFSFNTSTKVLTISSKNSATFYGNVISSCYFAD